MRTTILVGSISRFTSKLKNCRLPKFSSKLKDNLNSYKFNDATTLYIIIPLGVQNTGAHLEFLMNKMNKPTVYVSDNWP